MTGDESFSYNMIHHSFIDIINLTAQDVHPFLYYFIGEIFTYNITNMYLQIHMLRIVSALPYLILLIIGNTYIKNRFSKFTAILFMFSVIAAPLLIDNIYTIRMYGWSVLFTTIVYLLFISAYKNNNIKIFISLSLFAILSAYTHYYALITVFILYTLFLILFIVKKMKLKYLIISVVFDLILYFPWLKILLNQTTNASKNFWTPKLQLKSIIHMLIGSISPVNSLSPVNKLSFLYILPLLLITILVVMLNKTILNNKIIIIGILTPYLLILIGSVLSIVVGHSVIMIRYIVPAMGIFWLSLSMLVHNINNEHNILKNLLMTLILLISIMSYFQTDEHIINISKQFNQTLNVYNIIPKNSAIIYYDTEIMSGMSSYLNNNYDLNDTNTVYKKALNNFHQKYNSNLPLRYNSVFYIKSNKNNSKLIRNFNDKYVNNKNIHQIKSIYLPIEYNGKLKVYKIK